MDNNNFEQQFTRNVQQAATVPPATNAINNNPSTGGALSSKLPWIIVAGLSFIILLQVVALIIVLTNFSPAADDELEDGGEVDDTSVDGSDANFLYDDNENLVAFNATCTNNGSTYTFSTDNKYTSPNGSGTYSVINDGVVVLDNNTSHTLYYDSISVADGVTIYTCEEPTTEETEDTE